VSLSLVGVPSLQSTAASGSPATQLGAWGGLQSPQANDLLVALVTGAGTTSSGVTSQHAGTTGWTKVYEGNQANTTAAIWTKTAAGADAAPQFDCTIAGTSARCKMSVTLYVVRDSGGLPPVADTGNQATGTTASPLAVTTAGNVAGSGEIGLAVQCCLGSSSATNTWGRVANWSNDLNDGATTYNHLVIASSTSLASGAAATYNPTHTYTTTGEAAAIVVVKAGALAPAYPPWLIAYAETAWNTAGSKSTGSVTWQAGDLVVVLGACESTGSTIATPTFAGGTLAAGGAVGSGSQCQANSWTCTPASGGSGAVSSTGASALHYGLAVWVFRYHGGAGARAGVADTTLAVSLTRQQPHSRVVQIIGDYNATAVAGAWTPAVLNSRQAAVDGTLYAYYVADWDDQGSAGATSYGRTATSGTWSKIALEIIGGQQPPAAGAAEVTASRSRVALFRSYDY
jgi:hypothetical protein